LDSSIHRSIKELETEDEGDEYDFDGKKIKALVGDCGWSKRSYSHKCNSMSAAGVKIEPESKKIVYLGVKNKHCSICHQDHGKSDHECFNDKYGVTSNTRWL
jgi:cytochrome c